MSAICRSCSAPFEASHSQLQKSNFICKPCRAAQDKANRERRRREGLSVSGSAMPREYHQAYQQSYKDRPEVRARKREQAAQRRLDPIEQFKMDARLAVRRAISNGHIVRGHCEICGADKVDAHHDDYHAPLSVRWLCRLHHREHHAAKARGEG